MNSRGADWSRTFRSFLLFLERERKGLKTKRCALVEIASGQMRTCKADSRSRRCGTNFFAIKDFGSSQLDLEPVLGDVIDGRSLGSHRKPDNIFPLEGDFRGR